MIRLFTAATCGEAYLNFMGNEFGHPEWIDFPRPENGNSYHYARRQWSLVDNPFLRYSCLREFDRDMVALVKFGKVLVSGRARLGLSDNRRGVLVFERADYLFLFNWSNHRVDDYEIAVNREGVYQMMMSTEDERFGGDGCDTTTSYYTHTNGVDNKQPSIRVTLNARRALVLKREV